MKSRNHASAAISRIALEIATREAEDRRAMKTLCLHKQYNADLLQRLRRFVGLKPDPQLTSKESATNENATVDETAVTHKRKTA